MMVQLNLNCQKDYLCHKICLQITSVEDEPKYQISAKSEEWIVIQSKVMMVAHRKAFQI
jgi:hypothetical protein